MHINERLLVNFCKYSWDAGDIWLFILLHYTQHSSEFKCMTRSLRTKVFLLLFTGVCYHNRNLWIQRQWPCLPPFALEIVMFLFLSHHPSLNN